MTLQQFAAYYTALVKDLALCLPLAQQPDSRLDDLYPGAPHPLHKLQQLELRHASLTNSIAMLPRGDDLMSKIRVANLETLELSDDPDKVSAWLYVG